MKNWRAWTLALIGCGVVAAAVAQVLPAVFQIRSGDQLGLIDAAGHVLLAPEYAEVRIGDPLILLRKGSRTAYVDRQGKMVIAPQELLSQPYAEGLTAAPAATAQGQRRWGYVDAAGRSVIAPTFDDAQAFEGGVAVVGMADAWGTVKYGAIDRNGALKVAMVHDQLRTIGAGLLRAQSKDKVHRVFNSGGRDITPAGVDFVGIASEGLVRVWAGQLQGFMTLEGELVVAPRYAQASDFKEGRARVWIDGKYGYIDRRGQLAVPARWDGAEDFSDGLALVKEGVKEGVKDRTRLLFIDASGKPVIEPGPEVERAWPFSQGLAAVKIAGKHGYIDKRGQLVVAPTYSFVRAFEPGGLAYVGQGRSTAYIRRDGSVAWRSDAP